MKGYWGQRDRQLNSWRAYSTGTGSLTARPLVKCSRAMAHVCNSWVVREDTRALGLTFSPANRTSGYPARERDPDSKTKVHGIVRNCSHGWRRICVTGAPVYEHGAVHTWRTHMYAHTHRKTLSELEVNNGFQRKLSSPCTRRPMCPLKLRPHTHWDLSFSMGSANKSERGVSSF